MSCEYDVIEACKKIVEEVTYEGTEVSEILALELELFEEVFV